LANIADAAQPARIWLAQSCLIVGHQHKDKVRAAMSGKGGVFQFGR
jgi:hypothetical protein